MSSEILKLSAKYMRDLMLLFSIFILLRGHNHPGGGFIGGIMAGSGIFFYGLAYNTMKVYHQLALKPVHFIGIGLSICLVSSLLGLGLQGNILAGTWIKINIPLIGMLKLGTPLLFDTGVYFTVTGSFLLILFSIMEELEWKS